MRSIRKFFRLMTGLVLALTLGACGATGDRHQAYLGSQAVQLGELTPAEVAKAVQTQRRDDRILYRAPVISVSRLVDLRSAGPALGVQMGRTQLGSSGNLQGIRNLKTGDVAHYALYSSDYVQGKNRYVSVHLSDGQALHFTTVPTHEDPCVPECFVVFEALVIDLPDAALRATPEDGLVLSVTLDNGLNFPVPVPAAYVRGYLQAVDATPR